MDGWRYGIQEGMGNLEGRRGCIFKLGPRYRNNMSDICICKWRTCIPCCPSKLCECRIVIIFVSCINV